MEFYKGDIVRVKPEWLNPNETGDERYAVVEDSVGGRVRITLITDIDFIVPPVETVPAKCLMIAK